MKLRLSVQDNVGKCGLRENRGKSQLTLLFRLDLIILPSLKQFFYSAQGSVKFSPYLDVR